MIIVNKNTRSIAGVCKVKDLQENMMKAFSFIILKQNGGEFIPDHPN